MSLWLSRVLSKLDEVDVGDLPFFELFLELTALDVLPEEFHQVPQLLQGTALEERNPVDLPIPEPRHEGPKEVRLGRQRHAVEDQRFVHESQRDPLSFTQQLLESDGEVLERGGGGGVRGGVQAEILPGGIQAQEELLGFSEM